ncbi:MAG: hypothetical protein H7834_12130 [Magnetococcus sp. YQC-9]
MKKRIMAVSMALGLLGAVSLADAADRFVGQGTQIEGASQDKGMTVAAAAVTKDPTTTQPASSKKANKAPKKKAAKKAKKKSSAANRMAPGVVK